MAVNATVFWSSLTNRSYPLTMAYRAYCPNDWAKTFVRVTWFHRALVLSVGESRLSFLLIARVSLDFARFNGKAIRIRIRGCDNLIIGPFCSTVTLMSNFRYIRYNLKKMPNDRFLLQHSESKIKSQSDRCFSPSACFFQLPLIDRH